VNQVLLDSTWRFLAQGMDKLEFVGQRKDLKDKEFTRPRHSAGGRVEHT